MGTQAFKQKPCTKPERDKGKTDHPAYMIRPLGIIPWTDAFAHKKGSCNVFPCVNKYHADKTMAKLQSCQGHFICICFFKPGKSGQPSVTPFYDQWKKGACAINREHDNRRSPHKLWISPHPCFYRCKKDLQTPAGLKPDLSFLLYGQTASLPPDGTLFFS